MAPQIEVISGVRSWRLELAGDRSTVGKAAENDVVLTLRLQNSGNWSPESCSGNLDGEPASTVLVRVSLDELLAGGVEVTAPEPFRATLRLSARPAAG